MARTAVVLAVATLVLAAGCGGGTEQLASEAAETAAAPAETATPVPGVEPTAPPAPPAPTATPTPAPTSTPTPEPPTALDCVAEMPVRTRLGQLMLPLAVQSDLPVAVELAAKGELGGITLLGSPDADLASGLEELKAAFPSIPVTVAVDEEGGRVQRLAGLVGAIPSAWRVARTRSPDEAGALMRDHVEKVAGLGITMILAPVVDVGAGPAIGDRSYSDDPDVVARYARATRDAIVDAGLIPVLKHFPGHGRASADSHLSAATTPPLEDLRTSDLVPYRELLADSPAVMVGHLDVPGLTEGMPATLSSAAIDGYLRDELDFDGLVLTDALDMGAISQRWPATEAASRSLQAGADLLLLGSLAEVTPVIDHLAAEVETGVLDPKVIDDSVVRVLDAKGVDPCDRSTIGP